MNDGSPRSLLYVFILKCVQQRTYDRHDYDTGLRIGYLLIMSISGQIVSEIVAQLCLENSIQTLLNFFGSTQKKLEGFVRSFLSIIG